ncbi:MAG: YjbQ family protein [Nitrososphaerota archaeon]|nr:YjbQ family protein [Nitrososphaerota archaeon]
MIETHPIEFQTRGEGDILRITDEIQQILTKSGVKEGIVVVFLQSTTASVLIIEYEEGLLLDFKNAMERLAPKKALYHHENAWHDGNGHSHIRATATGQSLTLPISSGLLLLGQWQQVILVEFDVRPRTRTLIVQIQGE